MPVRLLVSLVATATAVAGLGACSSGDNNIQQTSDTKASRTEASGSGAEAAFGRLDPGEFAARMGNAGAAVINVHIPYEGELENTDAFIPFDHILGDARLPAAKDSEVLLYCMTGRMSESAANALITGAGYTNVAHLEGGMKAWEAAGRSLVHNPQHSE